jgi:hypothetical protein
MNMPLRKTYVISLSIFLTLASPFAHAKGEECADKLNGHLVLDSIKKSEWKAFAAKQIETFGKIALQGGVTHGRIHNQNQGEDCWAQTITLFLESWYEKQTGEKIRLSPERILATYLYESFHRHLGRIEKLVTKLKKDSPSERRKTLQLLDEAYGPRSLKNASDKDFLKQIAFIKDLVFHPDDGNANWDAIELVAKYGIVPELDVNGTINSNGKETGMEKNLYRAWDKLIDEARSTRDPADLAAVIAKYRKVDSSGINMTLFDFLKSDLDHDLTPHAFISPVDTFKYKGQSYTGESFYSAFFTAQKFDLHKDLVNVQATPATFDLSIKAIAIGLLRSDLPIPLGMTLAGDKILSDKSDKAVAFDFAVKTGLFTTIICPGGKCIEAYGGHEASIVNFFYRGKNGATVRAESRENLIASIMNDEVEITAFIFQNSWGEDTGVNINGAEPKTRTDGGYDVMTVESLVQTMKAPIKGPFDFGVPREIVEDRKFKDLVSKAQGHWKDP